ncbi:MAG: diacylglycerol kinase [Candidatus Obscuribacterales bacterium]|nr:diacylglycerol kinase [Steroidobacteraceae bacterium]
MPTATRATFTRDTPLFIVFNAGSGSGDKQQMQANIEREFGNAKRQCQLFRVERPEHIAECARRAVDGAVKHQGAVIVAGGDGTINAVATLTLPTGRPFGLLPQGTFNYSCRAHSIPLNTVAAAQALLDARIKPIQVGKVNERLFLVNASLGLYPQLLEDRERYTKRYGRTRAVAFVAGLLTLVRYRHQLLLEIEHDGQRELIRTPTVFVGNNPLQLDQVGLPEVEDVQHRRLAAVIVRPVSGAAMLWLALRGALGQLEDAKNARDFPFSSMTVSSTGRRTQPLLKVATDGEICWLKPPLRFSVAEQKLMLIVPATAPDKVSS